MQVQASPHHDHLSRRLLRSSSPWSTGVSYAYTVLQSKGRIPSAFAAPAAQSEQSRNLALPPRPSQRCTRNAEGSLRPRGWRIPNLHSYWRLLIETRDRVFVELSQRPVSCAEPHHLHDPTAFSTKVRASLLIMAWLIIFLIAGFLARLCAAQQAGWATGQVNATMCSWQAPRGTLTGYWGPSLLFAERPQLTEMQLLLFVTLSTSMEATCGGSQGCPMGHMEHLLMMVIQQEHSLNSSGCLLSQEIPWGLYIP
jgi:hypothetical protein